jgi:hypothetical protein
MGTSDNPHNTVAIRQTPGFLWLATRARNRPNIIPPPDTSDARAINTITNRKAGHLAFVCAQNMLLQVISWPQSGPLDICNIPTLPTAWLRATLWKMRIIGSGFPRYRAAIKAYPTFVTRAV